MPRTISIKKGMDIRLEGEAEQIVTDFPLPEMFAINPTDFYGILPKLLVAPGDEVLAGTPLFYDKNNEDIKFCSPVSGEITEIVRGEKRVLEEIRILADKEVKFIPRGKADPGDLSRETIISRLLESGAWPLIRQRPFGTIARPGDLPKSIFVSAFDSHPLAPDHDFTLKGYEEFFLTGIGVLEKLTNGPVFLNMRTGQRLGSFLQGNKGVTINYIKGPHPAGNVSVQIHHLDPLNKGEVVWYVQPQDVVVIGRLFVNGVYDTTRIVALTGSQVVRPCYFKTMAGANVTHLLEAGGLKPGENRVISGNALSGMQINPNGFLRFYDTQITVIPEGKDPEFMGWLKPGFGKFSTSRTFFSWLTPARKHKLDTNLHGEERPFVISGQYEKVLPMDIYPVQLLKSILVEDIELMENLGIYEVVEEDFALCEFVCTSKIESRKIIRHGMDLIRKELG